MDYYGLLHKLIVKSLEIFWKVKIRKGPYQSKSGERGQEVTFNVIAYIEIVTCMLCSTLVNPGGLEIKLTGLDLSKAES